MGLIGAGLVVILFIILTPWDIFPVEVIRHVTVLAITEHGFVGESEMGVSVVIPSWSAQVGDTAYARFFVPAMDQTDIMAK